jgi:hypothetical protein
MPKPTRRPDRPPSTDDRYEELVVELAARPDTCRHMLTQHVRTEDGFCAARPCGRPGTGTPYLVWPCPSLLLALRAHQHQQGAR